MKDACLMAILVSCVCCMVFASVYPGIYLMATWNPTGYESEKTERRGYIIMGVGCVCMCVILLFPTVACLI